MKIFFDLDGTLIDSKTRLYKLFQFLVKNSKFTYTEYWGLKRNKINHDEILKTYFKYDLNEIDKFKNEWLLLIEDKEWLKLDTPFEGVTNYLKQLNNHELFVVTARQFEQVTKDQIESFGWAGVFKNIMVTSGKREKHTIISELYKINDKDWMVGDTGKDIQTGKMMGTKTAAVTSGFLSKEQLSLYRPDIIVENIIDIDFLNMK